MYKFIVSKNKGKNQAYGLRATRTQLLWNALIPKCNGLVAKARPKLVQQSRALYRTSAAKVKRQKKNGVNGGKRPVLAPAPCSFAFGLTQAP